VGPVAGSPGTISFSLLVGANRPASKEVAQAVRDSLCPREGPGATPTIGSANAMGGVWAAAGE